MQKNIFVTGVTGKQGGAVATNLLKSGYAVTGLSRNPNSERAKFIQEKGIQIVQGDLNDPNSYKNHLENKDGIFSVQAFEYGQKIEIEQAKKLADLAKEYKSPHFIYSSVAGSNLKSGVPHFESKLVIENYIKSLNLPYSIIQPVSFYENFLNPEVTKRLFKGKLVIPTVKDFSQEFTGVNDIGIVATQMFNQPENYLNKTISLATDQKTMLELCSFFSETLGYQVKYQKLPGLITRIAMGKDLYKMFRWVNKARPKFVDNIDGLKKEFQGLSNMKDWIQKEF